MTAKKTVFSTQDLNMAAFIWCQEGTELIELKPKIEGGQRNTFKFFFSLPMSEAELTKLLFDYQNGKTLVEPSNFVKHQNYLRDQIKIAQGKNQ